MRIESDFHDYYDGLQSLTPGDSDVWNRKTNYIQLDIDKDTKKFIEKQEVWVGKIRYTIEPFIVLFCGKPYFAITYKSLFLLIDFFFEKIYISIGNYRIKKRKDGRYIVERLYLRTTGFKKFRKAASLNIWAPCRADGDAKPHTCYIYPDCYLATKEEAIERINRFKDGEKYYYPEDYIEKDN